MRTDSFGACSSVLAWVVCALVDVCFAVVSRVSCRAVAHAVVVCDVTGDLSVGAWLTVDSGAWVFDLASDSLVPAACEFVL